RPAREDPMPLPLEENCPAAPPATETQTHQALRTLARCLPQIQQRLPPPADQGLATAPPSEHGRDRHRPRASAQWDTSRGLREERAGETPGPFPAAGSQRNRTACPVGSRTSAAGPMRELPVSREGALRHLRKRGPRFRGEYRSPERSFAQSEKSPKCAGPPNSASGQTVRVSEDRGLF